MTSTLRQSTTAALAVLAIITAFFLSSCTSVGIEDRTQIADRFAGPAWMNKRVIAADPFALTVFERIHKRHAPATIYIEGDNVKFSNNPTPYNPVGLALASLDKSNNVISMARPCQYSAMLDRSKTCWIAETWEHKFSKEVIQSYQIAINEIINRYDIEGIHLIGYAGGATIAAALAASRKDVLSLRTIAGNLDTDLYTKNHELNAFNNAMNPTKFAAKLRNTPQIHFIGEQDEIISPALLRNFMKAMGRSSCASYELVEGATYDKNWSEKWPELLAKEPSCRNY